MDTNAYQTPSAELEEKDSFGEVTLWNPDVAGGWSIIFTPIFGSILVRKNWLTLGETKKANAGSIWIVVSCLMAFLSVLIPFVGLIYIIVWYYAYQRPQTKFVKSKVGSYLKKNWFKPLGIAIGCLVTFYLAVAIAITAIS